MTPAINLNAWPTPLCTCADMEAMAGQDLALTDENDNILTDENGNPLFTPPGN